MASLFNFYWKIFLITINKQMFTNNKNNAIIILVLEIGE